MVVSAEEVEAQEQIPLKQIDELKDMFAESSEKHADARSLAFRDERFYHNFNDDQWTEKEKKEMRLRNQPVVTSNWIKRRVNFLVGYEQRSRTDPRAWPKNPKLEMLSSVATQVLNHLEEKTGFDQIASRCFRELVVLGIEAVEVVVEPSAQGNPHIAINRIPYDKFFYDPRSRELDFSDARYMGYADWYDFDEALELFAQNEKAREYLESSYSDEAHMAEGYEDKPEVWGDKSRRRVRIAVVYYKMGAHNWHYAIYCGGGILMEGQSAYQDDRGYPCNPILAQSAYCTQDNERYGDIRDMIPLQREINMRRSLALALLKNRRMWQSHKGVFPDPQTAKKEVAKADAILTANGRFGEEWGFIESQSEIVGNFELLKETKEELQLQQANTALQGREVSSQSGRAILAQQQAGLTEENQIFDSHNSFKLRVYKALWARSKQFWTEAEYVRITKDPQSPQFLIINEPVLGQDPATGQVVPQGVNNRLAEIDVDITIDTVPDLVTLQHETFERLTELAEAGVPIPPMALIEMMPNFPMKQRIIEIIQEDQKAQQPILEQQNKIANDKEIATIQRILSEMRENEADAMQKQADAKKKTAEAAAILAGPPPEQNRGA